jgi:ATP-dependent protease ClpP protease subunit
MPGNYEDNIFFIGDFDDALERDVIIPLTQEIAKQSKEKDGRIDLYINSVGGYVHLVMHMVELVEIAKAQGIKVRTIVPDMAFSAGSALAVTGSPGERYIGRRAEHLIHYGQIMSFETTPEQIKRFSAWKDRKFKANLEHYQKYCKIPDLDKHILDDGFFVTAQQAIKWGMADKYMDKLEILPT